MLKRFLTLAFEPIVTLLALGLIAVVLLLAVAGPAHAATLDVLAAFDWTGIINTVAAPAVLVVLVPMAVGWLKTRLPIPPNLLPTLALILGPLFDQLFGYIASLETHGAGAALIGLAGVGVREMLRGWGVLPSSKPAPSA